MGPYSTLPTSCISCRRPHYSSLCRDCVARHRAPGTEPHESRSHDMHICTVYQKISSNVQHCCIFEPLAPCRGGQRLLEPWTTLRPPSLCLSRQFPRLGVAADSNVGSSSNSAVIQPRGVSCGGVSLPLTCTSHPTSWAYAKTL